MQAEIDTEMAKLNLNGYYRFQLLNQLTLVNENLNGIGNVLSQISKELATPDEEPQPQVPVSPAQ